MPINSNFTRRCAVFALTVIGIATSTHAAIVPYTEGFTTDAANWYNATSSAPLDWESVGGPDGSGYVSATFDPGSASAGDTPVLFRAQDEFGSSNGAFQGDYIAEGVSEFSMFVRHNGAAPINFFVRFSTPISFPGGIAVDFVPVFPNQWTKVTIAIDPFNPQFVTFEGSDFNTVFSNIGHIQIGPSIPASLAGSTDPIQFDLDQPSIVPEPMTGICLAAIGAVALVRRRRRTD